MPRKQTGKKVRKVITEYEEEDEQQPPQQEWSEADDLGEDMQVQSILDSVGPGDIKIKILKWGPKGKSYCFSLDGGPVDEDFIQAQFGGGRYHGQIFKNGIYTGNSFELNIAERINAPSANGGMADVQVRMMQQQIDFLKDMAIRGNQTQEREPINAIADAMLKMSQLQQAQAPPMPMETLLKCIELGKTLNGDGDWKTTLVEVVKESMPAIQGILMQGKSATASRTLPAAPAVQVNGGSVVDQLQVQLKAGIDFLKKKCLSGGDPGLYIDWIVDNREATPYAELIHSVVSQPFSSFAQIDPEIAKAPYETFFTSLYNGIREVFQEQGNVDVDTVKQTGDAKDAASHGGTGKTRKSGR